MRVSRAVQPFPCTIDGWRTEGTAARTIAHLAQRWIFGPLGVGLGGDRLQDVVHALAVEPCAGAGANGTMVVGGGIANACFTFAFGVPDVSSLGVSSCQLLGSLAQGGTEGSSAIGGDGLGGGLFIVSGTGVLKGVLVSGN